MNYKRDFGGDSMEFKLNEYHRDLTEKELINDLKNVSQKLCKSYISRSEYESNGRYSASPYIRCFGSWINALSVAGLETQRAKDDYIRISDQSLIEDIKNVAIMLNKDSISTKEYSENGSYKVQTILSRFGSWSKALNLAELKPTNYKEISDTDLFEEIEKIWVNKGSQPTTTDIKNGLSKYSLNTYLRRFGGWRNALKSFLDYIDEEYVNAERNKKHNNNKYTKSNKKTFKRRTPRDPNLKLRFQVLRRDNFKCCMCGRSPATTFVIKTRLCPPIDLTSSEELHDSYLIPSKSLSFNTH